MVPKPWGAFHARGRRVNLREVGLPGREQIGVRRQIECTPCRETHLPEVRPHTEMHAKPWDAPGIIACLDMACAMVYPCGIIQGPGMRDGGTLHFPTRRRKATSNSKRPGLPAEDTRQS